MDERERDSRANPGTTPPAPLGSRYAFVQTLSPTSWVARDTRGGQLVAVVLVPPGDAARYRKMVALRDRHLCDVVSVEGVVATPERPPGMSTEELEAVVVELLLGESLRDQVKRDGRVLPPRAIAWCLRLARSLEQLHNAGVHHGAVTPAAIVTRGPHHPVPPVLTQLLTPRLGLALSPEVLRGEGASPADDVWSLGVVLYYALTGAYPFTGTTAQEVLESMARGATPLKQHELDLPVLQQILDRVFASPLATRLATADALAAALDAIELERRPKLSAQPRPRPRRNTPPGDARSLLDGVVFDPNQAVLPEPLEEASPSRPSLQGSDGSRLAQAATTPLPPLEASDSVRQLSFSPPATHPFQKSKHAAWPFIAAALVAVAGVAFVLGRRGPAEGSDTAAQASAEAAPAPKPKRPKRPKRTLSPEERLNACVTSHYADDQFVAGTSFEFVCQDGRLDETARKLHELAEARLDARIEERNEQEQARLDALQRGELAPPPAGSAELDTVTGDFAKNRVRRSLGWYELLATAIVQQSCCSPPPATKLPKTRGWCDQLENVVGDLAEDSRRSGDLSPRIKRFDRAVDCLYANNIEIPFADYKERPLDDVQRSALQHFLSRAATSEARRRKLED